MIVEAAFWGCPSIVTEVDALPEVISRLDGIGVVVRPTREGLETALAEATPVPSAEREHLISVAGRMFGAS